MVGLPALLLAVLAARSTIASAIALPHAPILDGIRLGQPQPPAATREMIDASERAAAWFEPARHETEAAAGLIALAAENTPGTAMRAEALVREALRRAPASPYNWARLAWLRFHAGDLPGARAAWSMSVLAGRYVPSLMAARTLLAIRLLPLGDPVFEAEAVAQIRLFAHAMPRALAGVTRQAGAEPVVRAALASDEDARTAFNLESRKLAQGALQRIREQAH